MVHMCLIARVARVQVSGLSQTAQYLCSLSGKNIVVIRDVQCVLYFRQFQIQGAHKYKGCTICAVF